MTKLTDQLGYEFSIGYINCSQVDFIASPLSTKHFSYDTALLTTTISEMVDGVMQISAWRFDTDGNLRERTGSCCGYHQLYNYDAQNNLHELTDANGNIYHYSFGTKALFTGLTYPTGASLSWVYGTLYNRVISYTDANGNVYTGIYDPLGNLLTLIKPLGVIENYTYDPAGNMISYTDGKGNTTQYIRNSNGYINQIIYPDGTINSYTWNNAGNKLSYIDGNGNATNYIYDLANRLVQMTDALGNSTFYGYNARGERIAETNALGQTTTWTYDASGNTTSMTTPAGTSYWTYNGLGNMLTYTDNNGNVWSYIYNTQNLLASETDPLSNARQFTYDANGNKISQTDFLGNLTLFTYDAINRLIKITDALSNNTAVTYDNNSNRTSVTDALGHTTTYVYDGLDRLIQIQRPIGIRSNSYDANDNLTSVIDAMGHTTTYLYNNRNRMSGMTDALGGFATFAYDNEGNLISLVDRNGLNTSYTYNALGRKTSVVNPAGETTVYTYDAVGRMISAALPNGNIYTYNYDAAGRLISVIDNIGLLEAYLYDANSNRLAITDAGGHVTVYLYDALNRPTQIIDPMGRPALFVYNSNSEILNTLDRNLGITLHIYDNLGREILISYPSGNAITATYDAVGNLSSATDANGNSTQYFYDANDNLIREAFADGTSKQYAYDAEDKIISRTDNNSMVTLYSWDALHRLTGRNYPGSNDDTYSYDNEGRMLTANNNNATISWTYDNAGRILSENMNGKTTSYSYNIPINKRVLTYPGGRSIEENYDVRMRLSLIKEGANNLVTYTHDADNRILNRTYSNGSTATYSYNNNDWVTTISHNSSGSIIPNIAGFNYTYDFEGNILTAQKSHRTTNSEKYTYDPASRLASYMEGVLSGGNIPAPVTQTQFNYDGAQNRSIMVKDGITTNYIVNPLNQYTAIISGSPVNPIYDANGNTINDGNHIYTYDYENHLLTVDGGVTATYAYDALGRRIQKITPGGTVNYYFDKRKMIEERNAADIVQATYVYGAGIDDILTMRRGVADYFYHQNVLGTVVAISDNAGAVTERYEYDGYGRPTIYDAMYVPRAATVIGNTIMFTGREYDTETGYYYYRARTYNPVWGRFLQRDPVGVWLDEVNTGNGYGYVGNNPIIRVDPEGELFWVIAGVVIGGVALVVAVVDLVYEPAPKCVEGEIRPIRDYVENCSYTKMVNGEKIKIDGKRKVWRQQRCVNGKWKNWKEWSACK